MDNRKKIFQFVNKLQTQTSIPLWSIANESVIYACATENPPLFGPKTKFINQILKISYHCKMSDIVIFMVGLIKVISLWRQVKSTKINQYNTVKRIFAGFGASSEEFIYNDYIHESNDPTLRVNLVTNVGLSELGCPKLWLVILDLMKNSFGFTAKIKKAPSEISLNAVSFLTVCALNIGVFAFYKHYWRIAKSCNVTEVAFLALDIPVFAAVEAGINTVYLQHGLMSLCMLFPKVNRIEVLTLEEKNYLRKCFNNIQIIKLHNNKKIIQDNNPILMVLSLNVFKEERLQTSRPLIQLAAEHGMKIVLRPTIKANESELKFLHQHFPNAIMDDFTSSLEKSFEKWQPRFVAAWSSTGLALALDYNCLPISFYEPHDNEVWDNMIYSMRKRVLFWSRDSDLIKNAIQSKDVYTSQLDQLCNFNFDESTLLSICG